MSDSVSQQTVDESRSDAAVGNADLPPVEDEHWEGELPTPADAGDADGEAQLSKDSAVADGGPPDSERAEGSGESAGLSPGDTREDPVAALWGATSVNDLRAQWRELQLRFVDDPGEATAAAQSLVDSAVRSLTTTLLRQQQELDSWKSADGQDTEVLRVALRRYREFLDRLLGM